MPPRRTAPPKVPTHMLSVRPPLGPVHVTISKSYIVAQAMTMLKLTIKETTVLDLEPHGVVAKISIDLPPHKGWEGIHPKQFCGEFEEDSAKAIESASLVAINYLQENNLVVVDDANFVPLMICKSNLLEASSWASAFEMRTRDLQKQVATGHHAPTTTEPNTPPPKKHEATEGPYIADNAKNKFKRCFSQSLTRKSKENIVLTYYHDHSC